MKNALMALTMSLIPITLTLFTIIELNKAGF